MINEGFAFYYFYKKATFYDNTFKKAEANAKKNNVGVWKYCDGKREPVKDITQKTKIKTDSILGQ
jgi:endonuclease YncB( thermonuclease family)